MTPTLRTHRIVLALALAGGLPAGAASQEPAVEPPEPPPQAPAEAPAGDDHPAPAEHAGEEPGHDLHHAQGLYRELRDREALDMVTEYLVDHPYDEEARVLRARCLLRLGSPVEATRTLRALIEPSWDAQFLLAESLAWSEADWGEAQEILDRNLLADPENIEEKIARTRVLLVRADVLGMQNKLEEAQKLVREAHSRINIARQTQPRNLAAQSLAAQVLERLGRTDEARALLQDIIAKVDEYVGDPHDLKDAMATLAGLHMNAREYAEAIQYYEQILSHIPDDAEFLYRLGMALGMRERFGDAIEKLERSLAIEPGNALRRFRLAELYRSQKMVDQAIAQYEIIQKTTDEATLSSLRLAELYLQKGDLARADLNLGMVLELEPNSSEVQEVNGRILETKGELAAAKQAYRRSITPTGLKYDALYRLGRLLVQAEDPAEQAEGKAMLERHQRVEPYLPLILTVQMEIRLNPFGIASRVRLAELLNQAGEYEWAATWILGALSINRRDAAAHLQAGYIFANLGQDAEALRHFEQYRRFQPQALGRVPEYIEALQKGEPLPLPLK